MRRNALLHAALSAALVGAFALPAAGQDEEPERTPPPRQFPNMSILTLLDTADDPAVNGAIAEAVARAAAAVRAKEAPRVVVGDVDDLFDAAVEAGEEEENDIIVLTSVPQEDAIDLAREYPDTVFVGVNQGIPCVSADGIPDPSDTCQGDAATLVRNYASSEFRIDHAGFLAGVVAASVSRSGRIGAVGGWPGCADCDRYLQSFELGVRSVSPTASVIVAYLTDDDPEVANHDVETGRAFAEAFIGVNQLDVIFAASGGSSPGVIQAACDAGILAIGTDVDRAVQHPRLSRCILTSAIRDYDDSIAAEVYEVAEANRDPDTLFIGGGRTYDLANGGVGLAPYHDLDASVPVELPARLETATQGIIDGSIQTCLEACELATTVEGATPDGSGPEGSPAAEDETT
jgi:basic membrane protein A